MSRVLLAAILLISCSKEKVTPEINIKFSGYWFVEKFETQSFAKFEFEYPCNLISYGTGLGDFSISSPEAKIYAFDFDARNVFVESVSSVYVCLNNDRRESMYSGAGREIKIDDKLYVILDQSDNRMTWRTSVSGIQDSITYSLVRIR